MFETFIQTNSTKQNPFGSLNLNYQGEGISAWLLSSIAISIIFLTTIHNAHHQSGCNLQFWICHLQFINCNLHFSNCDLQFKNCNWLFTICKRYIFIATSPYPAISQVAAWYSTSLVPLLKPIRTCEILMYWRFHIFRFCLHRWFCPILIFCSILSFWKWLNLHIQIHCPSMHCPCFVQKPIPNLLGLWLAWH